MRILNPERRRTSRMYLHSQAQKALFDYVQELQLPKDILRKCANYMGEAWEFIPTINNVPQTALALIYLVIRTKKIQIPLKEFTKLLQKSDASKKRRDLLRTVSRLAIYFGIKIGPASPEEYTTYLIKQLQESKAISGRLHNAKIWIRFYFEWLTFYALQLNKFLTPDIRRGRNPLNLAAAVLCGADYLIGLDNCKRRGFITQIAIIQAAELKDPSVRENYLGIVKPILQSQEFESTFQKWRL